MFLSTIHTAASARVVLRSSAAFSTSTAVRISASKLPTALRNGLPRATTSSSNARTISTTPTVMEIINPNDPANAAIEDMSREYPEEHEFVPGDLGHAMDGPGVDVGKHQRRTLAVFSMTDKVCVLTGAARGLGNLFARTFVESGSNAVAILDLDRAQAEQSAKDIVTWFEEHGQASKGEIKAIGLGCDVSNEEEVKQCFSTVVDTFGRVDVLVTAAGIVENFSALDYPSNKFRKLMAVNVEGSYYCAREAAKDMIKRDAPGSIVMIGSMSGAAVNIPQPQAPYNASKAAVRHMASSLAVEWATRKIRVNVISPGYMATALTRVILERDPQLKETWENLTPMGRIGEPEDLKGAVIYLASDASAFTTGADLRVDGGYTLT